MTTTYTFDQLKEDVRKEAEALRVHATKEERGRLDIKSLNPRISKQCVYGLMCGVCDSDRAIDLIQLCASCLYRKPDGILIRTDGGLSDRVAIAMRYSPIEAYILLPEANSANLIAYLRGDTETLEL
jgi:hypothetical protein